MVQEQLPSRPDYPGDQRRLERLTLERRRRNRRAAIIGGAILACTVLLVAAGLLAYRLASHAANKPVPARVYKILIPEGLTVNQTADGVQSATDGHITADEFVAAARAGNYHYSFLAGAGGNLEGFLFPKTYDVTAATGARTMVKMLLRQFGRETSGLDWTRARKLGVTLYQVVIIASMIEKEVKVPAERPLVASVIYNRLGKGMKLGIDATVEYALGQWKPKLSDKDIQVDSPFNTYRISGLPPAPICSPGFESIRAALYPASTDYLYYILTSPAEGRHSFTADYRQFAEWKKQQAGKP
jgi:UPF0755 protein